MLLSWALATLPALAAMPSMRDDDALTALVAEIAPEIERVTGRTFVRLPEISWVSGPQLLDKHDAAMAEATRLESVDLETLRENRQRLSDQIDNSSALYMHLEQAIFVIRENFAPIGLPPWAALDLGTPMLRCVVAHELTHALQHQYSPFLSMDTEGSAGLMLFEGHAEHVMRSVCDPRGAEAADLFMGVDALASVRHPLITDYAYGERFVRAYIEEHGHEAIWWAIAQPAPTRRQIVDAVRPSIEQGWDSGARLMGTWEAMELPLFGVADVSVSPKEVSLLMGDTSTFEQLPAGRAGLLGNVETTGHTWSLGLFLMEDAATANAWLELRRAAVDGQRALSILGGPEGRSTWTSGEVKRFDAPATLQVEAKDIERYSESWAVRGPVVAVVAHWGGKRVKRKQVSAALTSLLAAGDTQATSSGVLLSKVPALAEPQPVDPFVHIDFVMMGAVRDFLQGNYDHCVRQALADTEVVAPSARASLQRIALECSVLREDLDATVSVFERIDRSAVPVDLQLSIIAQLLQRGDVKRSRDLLAEVDLSESSNPGAAATMALAIGLELWDRSLIRTHARNPEAEPELRYAAAGWMLQRGDLSGAVSVMRGLCPSLADASMRTECRNLYEALR